MYIRAQRKAYNLRFFGRQSRLKNPRPLGSKKRKCHDTCNFAKTNNRTASKDHIGADRLGNNYSHSDKKKVESCNDKLKDYNSQLDEIDAMIIADCEDWDKTFENEE